MPGKSYAMFKDKESNGKTHMRRVKK